jgi:3-oxoacyl-[acyl-carrier protein] reductase
VNNSHRLFNINVLGMILVTQGAVKQMGEGGSIINVSSGVSRITPAGSTVYTGTKAAISAIVSAPFLRQAEVVRG